MLSHRTINFMQVLDQLVEVPRDTWLGGGDAPVAGPRTFLWLMRCLHCNGGSPTSCHVRWRSETKLDYNSHGVAEHQCWICQVPLCRDQIDGSELFAAELGVPRVQATPSTGSFTEGDYHLFCHQKDSYVGVSLALLAWMDEAPRQASNGQQGTQRGTRRARVAGTLSKTFVR